MPKFSLRDSPLLWLLKIHKKEYAASFLLHFGCSAGNNFSYLAGHVSFQVFILVGHITKLVGH